MAASDSRSWGLSRCALVVFDLSFAQGRRIHCELAINALGTTAGPQAATHSMRMCDRRLAAVPIDRGAIHDVPR